MRVAAIIQARMGSTRLPGKVLKMLGDRTVLSHVIGRLKASRNVGRIIVATTVGEADDGIAQEAASNGAACYRGSENDVLSRYYGAAVECQADVIVRVTSDCPFLDPELVDRVIDTFNASNAEYARLNLQSFPRGLDVEVLSMRALKEMHETAADPEYREHVTLYAYQRPERYGNVSYSDSEDNSKYRFTLDTPEDWQVISEIYRHLHRPGHLFGYKEIVSFCRSHPEISGINLQVEQKHLTK